FHESNPHHSFTGLIDEVCITKRKLTETEIQNRIYQPVDLNLIYNVDDFSFDIVQGLTATKMLSVVSNNTAGYFRTLSDASWITIEPDSVYINPGDSVVITTTFNTSGIDYGNHETSIYFESDIPDVHGFSIPVEMAVFPNVDIDISGNSSIFQTGDTLSAYITVTNSSNYMTEAWIATAMRLPNGTLYGPVFGPYNFRLFPYGMVSGRIDHIVPGNAIVGDYEYLVRISTYSDMLTVMGQNGAEFSIYSSSQVS
ncbi:MAG: hypothetical protein GY855_04155, partial [candidate division Zixibacteria bacterium]|nr:hypothetical protein [candidate division Zixibacteria bacterium]